MIKRLLIIVLIGCGVCLAARAQLPFKSSLDSTALKSDTLPRNDTLKAIPDNLPHKDPL
ncbi:MAG TPA: hypothetical protein VG052_12325 [Puia sp.]|nr:hypothetical protein [Puia sp.]